MSRGGYREGLDVLKVDVKFIQFVAIFCPFL